MRGLKFMVLMFCALVICVPNADAAKRKRVGSRNTASQASSVRDARYADIIMNPVTGEIYHQDDPDGRRYPASLTKMMTLYMLFDALEQKKTSLEAELDVSNYAATMAQTNLALQPGDSIPVEVAIKALVVRSANDVAVVVAEALGGDVENFARMMTAKARTLGMNSTVFRNPNGLPNNAQYTTARDMAKLGIALKRDFPQYYNYFNTRQFSWAGVTYYTHNRVMLRYPGTDGIKTGYIGASGFNLVTSVTRGGRPLVGVVMGGSSGGWRDNRMIQLLDASYKVIAERGAIRGRSYPSNLPLGKRGGGKAVGLVADTNLSAEASSALLKAQGEMAAPDIAEPEDGAAAELSSAPTPAVSPAPAATPFSVVQGDRGVLHITPQSPAPAAVQKPAIVPAPPLAVSPQKAPVIVPKPTVPLTPAKSPFAQLAPAAAPPIQLAQPQPANNGGAWGIQVGAFSTEALAQQAANQSVQLAGSALKGAKIAIMGPAVAGTTVHRARIENITEKQAKKACEVLISNNSPCFIYKAIASQ